MFRVLGRVMRWLFLLGAAAVLILAVVLVYDSVRPPVSTLMMAHRLSGRSVDRRWVPLSAVSRHLVAAVVMSEDGQFCRHNGVDWNELNDVLNDPDGPSRGASTITMQTAKNLLLWPGRSFLRKGLEIPLALLLDALWDKDQVLTAYLNIAEWGDGIFGAEAAARHYFGKSAAQLSAREAALLATALPNPFLRNPQHPSRFQRERVSVILVRAAEATPWLTCLK